MKKQYPYSNDTEFLSKIDTLQVKEQWVRIILLEYSSEQPLENIEGKITSGNINKAGDSAVRRTCSLECSVDAFKYDPEDIKSSYSISKKIYLELGITNDTDDYPDEKIIWFPQGVFFITSFTISNSASGSINISLQFKDKMAQLDGTIGGVLPTTVRFDTVTSIINGMTVTSKALVYNIIMETVNHFGGEDLSNIIIDDIPRKAKRIIRWTGAESIWIYPIVGENGQISYDVCFTSDLDEKQFAHTPPKSNDQIIGAKEYKTNQDIGYIYEDFVYDEELTFPGGSKVTDVLDKIKTWLGNYEYFYDEQGQFHFQEIKNYLNNPQSTSIWNKVAGTDDIDYLYESTQGKAVYTFDDRINLTSITNTPVYENIKNDFIVEGTSTIDNVKRTCRYHLVIDDKPSIKSSGYDNVLIYTDPTTGDTTLGMPEIIEGNDNWLLPEFAEDGKIYGLLDEPQTYIFKQPIRDMENFANYYNNLANVENNLISQDILNSDEIEYLFNLLKRYMGYKDDTVFKQIYCDIIFSLSRQLERYHLEKISLTEEDNIIKEYYIDLYNQFDSTTNKESAAWCGGLLRLIYNLFDFNDNSIEEPSGDYIDSEYWPAISTNIPMLWDGVHPYSSEAGLRSARKAHCLELIGEVKIKQRQLGILIDQYTEIANNYTLLEQEEDKNRIQNQINNYREQLDICDERLTILYAVLTELGASDIIEGDVYYTKDVEIPILVTSFWYYDTDDSKNTYGWNKLEWSQYYNSDKSMSYINYSDINWENIAFDNENNKPSMNCSSNWYNNEFIPYAQRYDLPYLKSEDIGNYVPKNWRTELILRGLRAEENSTDPGYYYQELKANWPTIYDVESQQPISTSTNYIDYFVSSTGVVLGDNNSFSIEDPKGIVNTGDTTEAKFRDKEANIQNYTLNYENDYYNYFFDMIDSSSPTWGEYSVKNIGRRTNVNVKDGVNCVFAPDIPNFAFINVSGLTLEERQNAYRELKNIAEDVIQVTDIFHDNFGTGGFKQSAYEQIKYDLQQYTSYQNTVSITAIPCFYLEPNTRVKINDRTTNTYGDYVIKTISIPLGIGNNMSVSLSKAMERL